MKKSNWTNSLILSFLVLLFLPATGVAQTTNATISGTVTDETGGVIPGVELAVTDVDRGTGRTTVSDDEGRYTVPELVPGNYEVAASLAGFQTAVRSGLTLTVGRHAVVDLVLSIGAISERVVVTGEAPTVETTTSTISGLVDQNKIRDLPLNGRSFSDLVTLQMGTSAFSVGGTNSSSGFGKKISISGARPSSNAFLLDGSYVNDTLNNTPAGATGLFLGVETLQEFRVLTSTYSAEYGQSMGGVIIAASKSGTNELHGSVFYFHRNDNLDARNFFDTDSLDFTNRSDPPEFRRHQFGFTLGGPIVPNKTFIFGGFEGFRESLGTTTPIGTLTDELRSCVGVPAGTCPIIDPGPNRRTGETNQPLELGPGVEDYFIFFPRVNSPVPRTPSDGLGEALVRRTKVANEDNFMVKVDHNFSDSDTLFARYTFDDAEVENPGTNFSIFLVTRNQYFTLEEKHVFSPALLNVARFGFNRNAILDRDFPLFDYPEELQLVPTKFSAFPDFHKGLLGSFTPPGTGGFGFTEKIGGNIATPRIYRTNLFEYADTLTWISGKHSLKIGANIKRVQANMTSPQQTFGQLQMSGTAGLFNFYSGRGGALSFLTQDSNVQRGMRYTVMGFFIQDDFQIRPNLTFNLGLRYEPSSDHTEVNGKLSNLIDIRKDTELTVVDSLSKNPTKKNFAPRIGLAWDPFGDGKTAVRAGFGLFYNIQMSEVDRIAATSSPPFTTVATLTTTFPYDFETCCLDPGAARPALELVDYLNTPQSYRMQWNLNLQREVFPDTTFTLGYVGARGVDLFRVFQWNSPDPVDPSQCDSTGGPTCVNPDPSRSPYYFPLFGDRPDNSFLFGRTCPRGGPGFFRCPRLNPNVDAVIQRAGGADSYYNSLQLSLNKRFSKGFQVQGVYTWSHSIDTSSKEIRGVSESNQRYSTQNPLDLVGERGSSNFDVKHVFALNYTVDLPGQDLAGASGIVLGGWQLGGIVTMATGVPTTLLLGYDNCRCLSGEIFGVSFTDNRPDLIPGGDINPILSDGREPERYFDSSQFVPAPAGFHGKVARNTLRIPGVAQFDFSLVKESRISEEAQLQFRAEFFNILNRANFADPIPRLFLGVGRPDGSAGRIVKTTTTSRQIQFALKIIF